MKQFIALLFICFSTAIIAQNWSPILVNEKMNYQHSDSTYISHTIWVDSASFNTGDSIYYFNRVVKDVPDNPEIALRNQPQFLMNFMVKQDFGQYSFHYPNEYFLKTNLPVGATWTFDLMNNIEAEITAFVWEEVFGVMDSIEVISLSDGNEIRLSKNFGILKFPDFESGGYFELMGIQNTGYGESVPGFWEIYDFEVGDVFQYSEHYYDVYYTVYATRKIEITEKEILGNTLNYSYEGVFSGFGYDNKEWIAYPISGDLSYTDSSNHLLNSFPNQFQLMPDCNGINGTEDVFTSTKVFVDEVTNKATKQYGIYFDFVPYGNLYYILNGNSDTLFKYNTFWVLDQPAGLKGIRYSEQVGQIHRAEGFFEYEDWISLVGYVKDGDTIGTITLDSVLLAVSIDEKTYSKEQVIVFPNPAHDWLNFKFQNENSNDSYSIELRNLCGQLIKEDKYLQSQNHSMNVSDLKAGMYFYVIKDQIDIIQKGKIIIK